MLPNQNSIFCLPPIAVVKQLVDTVKIESLNPHNPVQVAQVPQPWELIGTGNYAAVFNHPNYNDLVVKIYAPGRSGWAEEVKVYRCLGAHQAFSECIYAEANWLILKRLHGVTLYDCMHLGLAIPRQVIQDIDLALEYAKSKGLNPHDVHGRNVMMSQGKGFVVDVSDFLDSSPCWTWKDLKKAYYWLYRPLFSWQRLPIPYWILDRIRSSYRFYRYILSAVADC